MKNEEFLKVATVLRKFFIWIYSFFFDMLLTILAIITATMAFSMGDTGCLNIILVWTWLTLASAGLAIFSNSTNEDYRRNWVVLLDRFLWLIIGVILIYNGWFITGGVAVTTFFLLIALKEVKQ